MPLEFNDLYMLVINSKVEIPARKYIDWPRGMPNSVNGDPALDLNQELRLSHTLHPDLLVSQPNMNPLITSQVPSPDRQLRPADQPRFNAISDVSRHDSPEMIESIKNLRDHRIKVVTKIMNGDVASLDQDAIEWNSRWQIVEIFGGSQDKEYKIAEEGQNLVNQFLQDKDDSTLQVGLMGAYQTYLNQDLFEQISNGHQQPSLNVVNVRRFPEGLRQGTALTEAENSNQSQELAVSGAISLTNEVQNDMASLSTGRPNAIRLQTVPELGSISARNPSSINHSNNANSIQPLINNINEAGRSSQHSDARVERSNVEGQGLQRSSIQSSNIVSGVRNLNGDSNGIRSVGHVSIQRSQPVQNSNLRSEIAEFEQISHGQSQAGVSIRGSPDRSSKSNHLESRRGGEHLSAIGQGGAENNEVSHDSGVSMNRLDRDRSIPSLNLNVKELRPEKEASKMAKNSPDKSPAFNVNLINLNPKPEANAWLNELHDSAHNTWSNLGKPIEMDRPVESASLKPRPKVNPRSETSNLFKNEVEQHILKLTQAQNPKSVADSAPQKQELDLPGISQLFPAQPASIAGSKLNFDMPAQNLISLFSPALLEKASALEKRRKDMEAVANADRKSLMELRTELAHFINERRRNPLSKLSDSLAQEKNPQLQECFNWVENTEQNIIFQKMNYIRMVEQAAKINRDMASEVVVTETKQLETDAIDNEKREAEAELKKMKDQRDRLLAKLDKQRRDIEGLDNDYKSNMSDTDKQRTNALKIQAFERLGSLKQKELQKYRDYLKSMERSYQGYQDASMRYYSHNGGHNELTMDFGKGLEALLNQTVKTHQGYRY